MILSRRHFFFGSLALPPLVAAKTAREEPSVVLILVDGLPAWVLGCYGGKDVRTPNIDQLCAAGVRFRNHFAASPSPRLGRASLLTGRTAMQLGSGQSAAPNEVTLASILGSLGYGCLATDAGAPDAVLAQAQKFLDGQTASRPFFLTAAFTDLVPPYEGVAQKYRDMYAQAPFDAWFPAEPPAPNATAGKEMPADLLGSLRRSAAAITAFDDRVGALLARLKQRQLLDNTLIAFTATCGSLFGRHGLWGSADASSPVNMFEETVATPMILRWPTRLPPQTTRPESVSACDFVPTLCEITGAAVPDRNLSGRSYLTVAMGKPLPKKLAWRNAVFSHLEDTDMVRDALFKLVLRDGGNGPNEFYDLQADPREAANGYAAGQYASIRPALAAEITQWKQRYSS